MGSPVRLDRPPRLAVGGYGHMGYTDVPLTPYRPSLDLLAEGRPSTPEGKGGWDRMYLQVKSRLS